MLWYNKGGWCGQLYPGLGVIKDWRVVAGVVVL